MDSRFDPPPAPTEAEISWMVRRFYELVRADPVLAPLFEQAVTDWEGHLRIIADFWSAVLLGTERYRGCVFGAHAGLAISPEQIERWLAAFRIAVAETLPAEAASKALQLSERMADAMQPRPRG